MLLTVSLLNKGSFLGSLINKCRQVIRNKNEKPLSINLTSSAPPKNATEFTNRPPADINLSRPLAAAASTKVTIEEKVGLPVRPKKPLTPYFRFMNEQRPKILASNPNMSIVDVVRQVSKKWETVDSSLKQRLQEEYKKEQQAYVEKRTKYESKVTDEQRHQIKELKQEQTEAKERRMMRKRIKELGRPKKPASAFIRFIAKERIRMPQTAKQTFREWHQAATQRWSELPQADKDIYLQESRKDFETYRKDIAVWEEKMIRMGNIDVVRQGNLIDPPEIKPKKR
ncbi:mitochondrial transcription factor A isoform X1 [Haematobia irritans]|uniref:mitochondrial transcription factor A isoform X1 n=1 Tax=Haematobia irritans TaxID=7368 RepID=UPI003F508E1B